MTNLFTTKTNFTSGELSPDLLGRVDLKSYDNGALILKNVFIEPTGGIYRRPGLKYVDSLDAVGRLITFEKSSSETYLIVLQDKKTRIYLNNQLVSTLSTPWFESQINTVRWCQGVDALYLVHPDVAPQKLVLTEDGWQLVAFSFLTDLECLLQPYHKFCEDSVTIASDKVTGDVTLTASADVFKLSHVGCQFKLAQGYVRIDTYESPTSVKGKVLKKLISDADDTTSLTATRSWGEPAFDDEKGYPATVAFYQSRLVFGGSRKLPNYLWFSQSGDLTNFELGEGYDAEAIEFSILSDQSNAICALFAGRHLQVFTTNAEWMVTGDPLTPTNIQLKRQTQVGSTNDRFVPPIGIDGATIFPAANGLEMREFLFADIEQAYQATDLSLLAGHLINQPRDQAYDRYLRQAYILMSDGRLCVLTSFRAEDIQSWTEQITDGEFLSVAVGAGKAYFIIKRNNAYHLEQLDKSFSTDCSFEFLSDTGKSVFSGLSVLEGKRVKIIADNIVQPDQTVQDGKVVLEYSAKKVRIGLPFKHQVAPLPPVVGASNGAAPVSSARLVKAVFRVVDTETLEIDTGTGLHQELTRPLASYKLDGVQSPKTMDVVVRSLGWKRIPTSPLWVIEGENPKSFKLVSVTSDIQIGG